MTPSNLNKQPKRMFLFLNDMLILIKTADIFLHPMLMILIKNSSFHKTTQKNMIAIKPDRTRSN